MDGKTELDYRLLDITNDSVFNAIQADLDVRLGKIDADLDVRLGKIDKSPRTEALAAALAYPVEFSTEMVNLLESARKAVLSGDSSTARQLIMAAQPTSAEERAAVGRWTLALEVFGGSSVSERTNNRSKILTVINRLTRDWQDDAQSEIAAVESTGAQVKLETVINTLDDLGRRTTGVESYIKTLRDEATVRLNYLSALKEKTTQDRRDKLIPLQRLPEDVAAHLPGFEATVSAAIADSQVVAVTSAYFDEALQIVDAAYTGLTATLKQLGGVWTDAKIASAIQTFDREYETARVLVLLRAPDMRIQFRQAIVKYLALPDMMNSLRFERGESISASDVDTMLRAANASVLQPLAMASPAVRRPLNIIYNDFYKGANGAIQSFKDQIDTHGRTTFSSLHETANSLMQRVNPPLDSTREKPKTKQTGGFLAWLPLAVAGLALIIAVIGVFTGGSGVSSTDLMPTQVANTDLAQTLTADSTTDSSEVGTNPTDSPENPTVDSNTTSALTELDIEATTAAAIPPTETPTNTPTATATVTATPVPLGVDIAVPSLPFYTNLENVTYVVAGESYTISYQLTVRDGQPFPESQDVIFASGSETKTYQTDVTGSLSVSYTPILLEGESQKDDVLTLSISSGQLITASELRMVVKIVGKMGDITIDPESVTWLNKGLITTKSASEFPELPDAKLKTLHFLNVGEGYPLNAKYEVLYAPPGKIPALTLFGSSFSADSVIQSTIPADGNVQLQAEEAGLFKLIITDPLHHDTEVVTLVFAAGYEWIFTRDPEIAGADKQIFISVNGLQVSFASDNRYKSCGGAEYSALVMSHYEFESGASVLLNAFVQTVTQSATGESIVTIIAPVVSPDNTPEYTKIDAAPPIMPAPGSFETCIGFVTDPAIPGPLVLSGVPYLVVYPSGEKRDHNNVTYELVYFEAIAPSNLLPTPTPAIIDSVDVNSGASSPTMPPVPTLIPTPEG